MLNQELQENIGAAADVLLQGGVLAFPTETVYGLGADASNPQALRRVFEIKGRPAGQPLIVHFCHVSLLDYWAGEIPDGARRLATHFWPGPLTLILPRRAHVSRLVTGGRDTVGLRVPEHPAALALLRKMGVDKGLAASSANRFGHLSPTTAAHVRAELGGAVDMILDGGACRVGMESTIVSFNGAAPVLLRPGGIAVPALEKVLGHKISQPGAAMLTRRTLCRPSHCAPATQIEVWPAYALKRRAWKLAAQGQRVAVLELTEAPSPYPDSPHLFTYPMPTQATVYARALYAALHNVTGARFNRILAEAPPRTTGWQAVHDRLRRAATLYCPTETQPWERLYA